MLPRTDSCRLPHVPVKRASQRLVGIYQPLSWHWGYRALRKTTGGIELTSEVIKLAAQASKMSEAAANLGQVIEGITLT